MKKTLEYLTKGLIYIIFFVPLVVAPASFIFPFIVPKILLLRSLTTLTVASFILLLIINWKEYRPKLSPLNIAVFLFLLSFTLSTFIGTDSYHSFWDNHERMLGLFTLFHYVALYFIASSLFKDWGEWNRALKVFLIAGSLVMIVGILQVKNPYLLLNQGNDRVASTLGNSIYVGGYGLFLTFVSYLVFIKEKSRGWKIAVACMGVLALLGMFFSGTRGSMLGFLAGIGVATLGYSIILKNHPKVRKTLWGLIGVGIVVLGILYFYRTSDFVRRIPAVGRTLNTSYSDVKASARWIAWEIAVKSWKERPLFGWGPNNYFYAFNKYYNPRSLNFGYGETWFDNAHNIILNTLAVQGMFGLLSYLSIFIVGIVVLWQKKSRINDPHVVVIGSAFLVAHLIQNITVFENPTSYLYFMFWLAMVNGLTIDKTEAIDKKEKYTAERKVGIGLVGTLGVIAIIWIFIFNIQPAKANMKALDALRKLNSNPILGQEAMRQALTFNSPHIDDIRSDLARATTQVLNGVNNKLGKERSNEIFNLAYENLKKNLTLHPLDIRVHLTLAQLSQVSAMINNDPRYIFEAERYMKAALDLSPRRQQIVYSLSGIEMQLGKPQEAVRMLEQTLNDNQSIAESYWRLAYAYKIMGEQKRAEEVIALAGKNGIVFDQQTEQLIAQFLTEPTSSKKR